MNKISILIFLILISVCASCTLNKYTIDFNNSNIKYSEVTKDFYADSSLRDSIAAIIESCYSWYGVPMQYAENMEGKSLVLFKYNTKRQKIFDIKIENPSYIKEVDENMIKNIRRIALKENSPSKSDVYNFIITIDLNKTKGPEHLKH